MLYACFVVHVHTQADEHLMTHDGGLIWVFNTFKQERHSWLEDFLHLSKHKGDLVLK